MKKVLVVTGAGISAESGVPTFRGASGYWRNLDPRRLATPEAFVKDPDTVWQWYRERRALVRTKKPNAAHEAIVRLAHETGEFLLLTQNVDDLHQRAVWNGRRLPADRIVQIHGDLFLTRCVRCSFWRRDDTDDADGVPRCPSCGASLRPGVVWFGEELNLADMARVHEYLARGPCDVVLVVGTTAAFDYIVDWATRAVAPGGQIIEVNPEVTRLSPAATVTVREPAATVLPDLVDRLIILRNRVSSA